jgi:hypothetical protein
MMNVDRENIDMSETLSENWGVITPAMQERVNEALIWNRNERLARMQAVLADCLTVEELLVNFKQMDDPFEMIESKTLIAADLGDAGYFIPRWQFAKKELEEGQVSIRPELAKLWSVGSHNGLLFCGIMTNEWRKSGKTPLELIDEGDTKILEDIDFLFRYPPGM